MSAQPPAPAGIDPSPLARVEALEHAIEPLPTDEEIAVLEKLVPLVIPEHQPGPTPAAAIDTVFSFTEWHFSGVGLWSVLADTTVTSRLEATFFPPRQPPKGPGIAVAVDRVVVAPIAGIAARVCDLTCPNRWPLRVLVFFVAALSSLYALASLWVFALREVYGHRYFPRAVAAVMALLVVTLLCDPYWKQQQVAILFVSLGGFLGFLVFSQSRKRRERNYP